MLKLETTEGPIYVNRKSIDVIKESKYKYAEDDGFLSPCCDVYVSCGSSCMIYRIKGSPDEVENMVREHLRMPFKPKI